MATLGEQAVGSIVKLNESGSPVEFIVVQQGNPDPALYDASCDGTWVLMKNIYTNGKWDDNDNDYAHSNVHSYLNNNFLNVLDEDIKEAIKQVKIPYQKGTGAGGSVASGANGLSCKIFLLSGYELGWTKSDNSYFPQDGAKLDYFQQGTGSAADQKRIAKLNGSPAGWWTRSPYMGGSNSVWLVYSIGDGGRRNCGNTYGVRPGFILPSSLLVSDDGTVLTNEPPTAPGSIDVQGVVGGGNATITLTAASDTDGTIASYIYERSVDGGAWTQFADVNSLTQTDSVSEDWGTVAYRACAKDNLGAVGPYITSETKTVNTGWLTIGGPDPALGQRQRPFTLTASIGVSGASGVTGISTKTYLDNVLKSSGTVNQGAEISEFVDVRTMSSGGHTLQFVAEHEDYLSATKAWQFTIMGDALPAYGKADQLYNDDGAPIFPKTTTRQVIGPNGQSVQNEIENLRNAQRGTTGHLELVDTIYNKSGVEIAREAGTVYAFRLYDTYNVSAPGHLFFVPPSVDTGGNVWFGVTIAADKFTINATNAIIEVYKYVLDMVDVTVGVDPATQFAAITQPRVMGVTSTDAYTAEDLNDALQKLLDANEANNSTYFQYKVQSEIDSAEYYVLTSADVATAGGGTASAWVSTAEPTKVYGLGADGSGAPSGTLTLEDTADIASTFVAADSKFVPYSKTSANPQTVDDASLAETLTKMCVATPTGNRYRLQDSLGNSYYIILADGAELKTSVVEYSVKGICTAAGTWYQNETITMDVYAYFKPVVIIAGTRGASVGSGAYNTEREALVALVTTQNLPYLYKVTDKDDTIEYSASAVELETFNYENGDWWNYTYPLQTRYNDNKYELMRGGYGNISHIDFNP